MTTMRNLTIVVFCCAAAFTQAGTFEALLKKHKQTNARFSIYAVEAASGEVLYRVDSAQQRIPASNMKLVTSAAAMHYLGGEYVFETHVALLDGDLIVIGGGDPLLADPGENHAKQQAEAVVLDNIVQAVKQAGISEIENVIIDTSFFDNDRVHPSWPKDQLNQKYACEVSGMNFYSNCIFLKATRSGKSALLEMEPRNSYVHLVNQLQLTSQGNSTLGAYRNTVPNKLVVKGKVNKECGFEVAIENPAGLFASVLCDRLCAEGIQVKGQLLQKYVKNEKSLHPLLVLKTPLKDVLKRCNTDSLGLAAECMVKTISAEHTKGRINGQWAHGLELTAQYLSSLGIDPSHYILDDGSGLSRKNRVTAECLVAVLKDMYQGQNAGIFFDSLAVGGVDGTAGKFFGEPPYKGNILGKTGYISGVRSFSGICKTPNGDILFSILTEGGSSATRACINDITCAIFERRL